MNVPKCRSTTADTLRRRAKALLATLVLGAMGLAPAIGMAASRYYQKTLLVSDTAGLAASVDANLRGAWGLARSNTGPWWVNSTTANLSLAYDGSGNPTPAGAPRVVTTVSTPTGLVFNATADFALSGSPASFLFSTLGGTISAWNETASPAIATVVVDHSGSAAYTGLAIASSQGASRLYAANFSAGKIEVFDGAFNAISLTPGAFVDPKIPSNFGPFNIQAIGERLYVTYARLDALQTLAGARKGFVDVFDTDGGLIMRLKRGSWMRAPWGVALAPSSFGKYSNRILVGMFGSGRIAVFNARNGAFRDYLKTRSGAPITVARGLWGIGFGNDSGAGAASTLYFASDIDGSHGVFGSINPAQRPTQTGPTPTPTTGPYGY